MSKGFFIEGDKCLTDNDRFFLTLFLRAKFDFQEGKLPNVLTGSIDGGSPIIVNTDSHTFRKGYNGKSRPFEDLAILAKMPGCEKLADSKGQLDFTKPVTVYPYYDHMGVNVVAERVKGLNQWGVKEIRWAHRCDGQRIELNPLEKQIDVGVYSEVHTAPNTGLLEYNQPIKWSQAGKGCDCESGVISLYNIPLLYQTSKDATVYWTEGEKDADMLSSVGLPAICHHEGSGIGWKNALPRKVKNYMNNKNVVILSDADSKGQAYAMWAANHLVNSVGVLSVKIVKFQDKFGRSKDGFDVSDWVKFGGSIDELVNCTNEAKDISGFLRGVDEAICTIGF